jgi:hypothetical protein
MLAFMAWANNREFYALLGLRGPPLEWLAQIEPEQKEEAKGEALLPEPRRPGVKTPLDLIPGSESLSLFGQQRV